MPSAPFNANSMQPFGSWQLTNTVLKLFGQSMTTPAVLSAPVFSPLLPKQWWIFLCFSGWSCMILRKKIVSINQKATLIISLLGHMLQTLRTSISKEENIVSDVKLMDVSCTVCDNDTRISKRRGSSQTCLSCFMWSGL